MIEHVLDQLRPHFAQILISAKTADAFLFDGVEVVQDETTGLGPLIGVISALKASGHDKNFVQACDIPDTNITLVKQLLRSVDGYDAATPRNPDGRCEPLFSVYRKSALEPMEMMLRQGQKSVHKLFGFCKTNFIDINEQGMIVNLNTMADYLDYIKADS